MRSLLKTANRPPQDVATLLDLAEALLAPRVTGRIGSPEHARYGAVGSC